jgi:hypothetical protein
MQHSGKCLSVQTLICCAALQVIPNARTLSLTAAVRAIRTMLRRGMKRMSIVAIRSKSVYIAVVGTVVSGAIVYALLHCCGSRLKGVPAVKLVLEAPQGAVAVILLPINMACHMTAKLAHGAGEHARPHTSRPLHTSSWRSSSKATAFWWCMWQDCYLRRGQCSPILPMSTQGSS